MKSYLADGRLWRLCQKELRESLRDRRTIVTLVLMPILVYPLLSMALQRLILGTAGKTNTNTQYVIGVRDETDANIIGQALAQTQQAASSGVTSPIVIRRSEFSQAQPTDPEGGSSSTAADKTAADKTPTGATDSNSVDSNATKPTTTSSTTSSESNGEVSEERASTPPDAAFSIAIVSGISIEEALKEGQIDLAVTNAAEEIVALRRGDASVFRLQVDFRQGDLRSENALSELRRAMQLLNDQQAEVIRKRFDPRFPPAVEMTAKGTGQRADLSSTLAGVIPLVLILMTITGAVYPAIDLTAGERERGTMEAMIATPAPRFVLLLSKYVAVVTVAVLTALANLFATWVTLSVGGLGKAILGENGFSLMTLMQILPLLVIFAAFFSAILLALCSFARSFKEAQAYLIPVMLLSLGPGLITLMPGVQFTTTLGVVPLVNILLLSRDIMTGQSTLIPAFAAVFSTIIYAAATLVIASKLFGAEAATAGSQETWSDLLRRPKHQENAPEIGQLAIYLALFFPLFFVTTNLMAKLPVSRSGMLIANAVALVAMFMALPLLYSWYRNLNVGRTFRLVRAPTHATINSSQTVRLLRGVAVFVSVAFLAAGLWMVAYEALLLGDEIGLIPLSLEKSALLETAKAEFLKIPFLLILFTGAIAPAFAEEFFFRGFVISAFLTKLSPPRAVIYSAILFGLFHVITGSTLSLERFAPTAILGLALGTLAVTTRSLWPGILLHAVHNGLMFWIGRIPEEKLTEMFGSDSRHLPWIWFVGGILSIVVGFVVLFLATRTSSKE